MAKSSFTCMHEYGAKIAGPTAGDLQMHLGLMSSCYIYISVVGLNMQLDLETYQNKTMNKNVVNNPAKNAWDADFFFFFT